MRVETERMYLYPLSDEEMRLVIENESDPEMKQAYTEMLEGSLSNSVKRLVFHHLPSYLTYHPLRAYGRFYLPVPFRQF